MSLFWITGQHHNTPCIWTGCSVLVAVNITCVHMHGDSCTVLDSNYTGHLRCECVAHLMQHPNTEQTGSTKRNTLRCTQAAAQHARSTKKKDVEEQGIDPCTSDMQSQRSTI